MKENEKKQSDNFKGVYPFATENVASYFTRLDLQGKTLLTLGSSLDQAFNALLLGAKNITVFDINPNTQEFYKLKKDLIMTTPKEKLYYKVLENKDKVAYSSDIHDKKAVEKMNLYLQSEENYQKLRKLLEKNNIDFVTGDIFNLDDKLGNKQFDRIALSNVVQYLYLNANGKDQYEFLAECFSKWKNHLTDKGILQLLYLYSYSQKDLRRNNFTNASYNLKSVTDALRGNGLEIEWFESFSGKEQDAIVTYTKRR